MLSHVRNRDQVLLLGLDFGTTTSSALLAQANIGSHCITGRMALHEPHILYRGEPVFTPFSDGAINESAIRSLLEFWLSEAGVAPAELFAGGVIITGLAAQQRNANTLAQLVGELLGDLLITRANDGGLESWLAFMGSCSALSRFHPEQPIINLDIGGGTTNAALGLAGNVLAGGCHFIGARHFQFIPGSYQISALSTYGAALLHELGIRKELGEHLTESERERILAYYIDVLEALVEGRHALFDSPVGKLTEQIPFTLPKYTGEVAVTFSGGVGELLYRHLAGEALPGTTYYGDLGIDLAQAIAASPKLVRNAHHLLPENRGRATVYGLTLHSTEISGSTLYLPQPQILPLKDIPIVARLKDNASLDQLTAVLALARSNVNGACLQLLTGQASLDLTAIRSLGARLATAIEAAGLSSTQPLVLLMEGNAGKALGHYTSDWGRRPLNLVVIDEVRERQAHFVNLGKPHQGIVPVAFYGVH